MTFSVNFLFLFPLKLKGIKELNLKESFKIIYNVGN